MKFTKIKEQFSNKMNSGKEYIKTHKKQIIIAGISGVGLTMLGVFFGKKLYDDNPLKDIFKGLSDDADISIIHNVSNIDDIGRDIDEEIFTEIACEMEAKLLDFDGPDNEPWHFEKAYDIGKGVMKNLTIDITTNKEG